MSDQLEERLLAYANAYANEEAELLEEAADTIAQLRAELDIAKRSIEADFKAHRALEAEVAALNVALNALAYDKAELLDDIESADEAFIAHLNNHDCTPIKRCC